MSSVSGETMSMTRPTVCAVMLTKDRPEMARRAVECFRRQTYPAKHLMILADIGKDYVLEWRSDNIHVLRIPQLPTIGANRNFANDLGLALLEDFDIQALIHWDDDDWSHPNRIAEQVAFLQSSGAECVGYDSMLFYDQRPGQFAAAYLYSGFPLGTSLCYWRKAWEREKFPATSYGEDTEWLKRVKWKAVPSICSDGEPRMIASIHGGNTASHHAIKALNSNQWKRVPEWDGFCQETMQL